MRLPLAPQPPEITFLGPAPPMPTLAARGSELPTASQGMLKAARRLLRRKDRELARRFIAEGRQATSEALRQPGTVIELIVADDSVDRHHDLLKEASQRGVQMAVAPSPAVAELSATVTPQGLIAVCQMIDVSATDALTDTCRLAVFCDQIRDPGNLGTVIRCADAFGADAVLISPASVDVYSPKTVRATTGSLFHLPLAVRIDLEHAIGLARDRGLQVVGADAAAPYMINDLVRSGELANPTMWVMGNEAWGLSPQHQVLLDRLVAVPLYGRAESLNLSTAAAVLLYASATAQRADTSSG
jgi:RNA methyltransferase, TrmH family